jgi:hypothetical protein
MQGVILGDAIMLRELAETANKPKSPDKTFTARTARLNLFLAGFLVLFMELACIRWFSSSVIFLQFFTPTFSV